MADDFETADTFAQNRMRMAPFLGLLILVVQQGTLYAYPAGINWAGIIALVAGAAFYLWLYNPITLETQAVFSVITASLPAAIVAALVYLGLSAVLHRGRAMVGAR